VCIHRGTDAEGVTAIVCCHRAKTGNAVIFAEVVCCMCLRHPCRTASCHSAEISRYYMCWPILQDAMLYRC
jgi:hypothetical protein